MKKRLFSWLLVLTMLLGMFPVSAIAADSITVYVSVVQNGEFVTGKDSKTIAYVPVTVSTHEPTIGDAFTVLHETYCESGLSGYETTQMSWGASVTKFWGVTSSTVGYYNNNSYAMGLTDSVTDGAHLVFWFYQDTSGWSDSYTYFDQTTASLAGGAALELTASASGLSVTVDGSAVPGKATDANGKVTLHFAEAGTYIVSAKATGSSYIVPPVCIVDVSGDDPDAASTVASDKEALTLPEEVTEDLALPAVGTSGKTSISWVSSDSSVISDSGLVTRGAEEKLVTLTATLTYGDSSDAKEFTVTVPALSDTELLAAAASALTAAAPITANQYNADYTAVGDTNIVTVAQRIVNAAVSGVTVGSTVVSENGNIAEDGAITYGTSESRGDVSFTISKGELSGFVTVNVSVPADTPTRQSVMDQVTAEVLGKYILDENDALDNITSDLDLPASDMSNVLDDYMSGMMVQVAWTIPAEGSAYLSRYGDVTRPAYQSGDVSFDLTCTLSWYSMMDAYMPGYFVGPTPENKVLTFPVTIKEITETEYTAAKEAVDTALKNFNTTVITYYDGGAAADLNAVTGDLMLPEVDKEAPYGTYETDWTTSEAGIVAAPSYNTGRAVVTRPAVGEEDTSCTLTMTVTKDGYTDSKAFPVTVKALTQAEVNAAQAEVQEIADALTFDVIKDANTTADSVTARLRVWRSAFFNGDKTISWSASAYPTTGFKIDWTYNPEGIFDQYGYVTAPVIDTEVTLTASVYSADKSYTQPVPVEIIVTVPAAHTANTAASLEPLMDGIAAQTTATTNWESFLAMAAYEDARPSVSKLTEAAKQNMLNSSLNAVSATNPDEDAYAKAILDMQSIGVNPRELYPVNRNTPVDAVAGLNGKAHSSAIWTAAYTLLAYQQGGYSTGTQEADVVTALLGTQLESGGWTSYGETAEADATGLAIQALAAYYDTNSSVKTAVDKAIRYLSEIQLDNGGFGGTWGENANNAACVIMGLCAMGINPDTDSRFIKNGYSVLDALLAYAVEDNSGFALSIGGEQVNGYATQQGFPALVAAYQVVKTGQAFNVYDFSRNTLSPGRATGAGTVSTPENPSGNSITVTLTIKSDTGYWLNSKTVTIPGTGATVYHALIEALKGSGITQTGAASGYVETMTKGGQTLAEFTNGKDSGWMYKVNGELPEVGLTDCDIANGDTIVWFYTNDWTTVPGATSSFGGTKVSEEDRAAAREVKGLIAAIGTVTERSGDAIKAAREAYDTLTDTQKELVPNYDDLLEAEKKYAELAGKTLAFADVNESDYFYEAVKWAAEMGITSGTSETTFSPHASCTRAQMVTFLWRAAGTPEPADSETSFGDVDKEAYYYKALLWAVENGITSGTSATTFSPDAVCTRGQMAMFLYRSAETPDVSGSNSFTDVDDGAYYKEAVIWAKNEDITTGTSATTFSPDAACTRAQMVTFLFRYLAE